jgi:hypothetical protein
MSTIGKSIGLGTAFLAGIAIAANAARSRRALISILFVLLGSTLPGSKPSRAQTSEPTTEQLQREIR